MKASELRIGNWVKGAFDCEIQATASNILNFFHGMNDLEPIPLNEEWLLKFGFEKFEMKSSTRYSLDYNFLKVTITKLNAITKVVVLNNYIPTIKHVHQLQNLYHALTGHELKTKQDDK